jgi:uncharacterized membrane protein
MSTRRTMIRVGVVLAVALAAGSADANAQARSSQQRTAPQGDARAQRPGQVLLDRFAQRVGRALRLDAEQTRRLLSELRESREQRGRIAAQARAVRQELQRLIRESSTDEDRIERLLDEAAGLEVTAAQVAVDEQRRLAEFLTPLQRARFVWVRQRLMQEALRQTDSLPTRGILPRN